MSLGAKIIEIPKAYSEEDQALRQQCIEALEHLRRDYEAETKLWVDRLVEIDNRYPPKLMIAALGSKRTKAF